MTKEIKSKKIKETKSEAKKELPAQEAVDMSEVAKELLALRKELETLKTEKKAYSDAEKAAIEAAREDMLTDEEEGDLYIDEKYNENGYTYRIVDSSRPNRINSLIKKGYEIQYEDGAEIGDKVVGKAHSLTSAVTVELGKSKSKLGIRMRIPTELYEKRQKLKAKRIKDEMEMTVQNAVGKSQFGEITIGSK